MRYILFMKMEEQTGGKRKAEALENSGLQAISTFPFFRLTLVVLGFVRKYSFVPGGVLLQVIEQLELCICIWITYKLFANVSSFFGRARDK